MAGFAYLETQSDPKLKPTKAGVLAYFAGFLLLAGATFQVTLGFQGTPEVLGLRGGSLIALGVIGAFDGIVLAVLAALISAGTGPFRVKVSGYGMILLSVAGLFTSFLGFFVVGTALGVIAGILAVRARVSG